MYYLGNGGDMPVKPVTRRTTLTRGMPRRVGKRYLQRQGRKPLNRHAYPTMGTPVAVDLSMQPGHFGSVNDPILLSVRTRAGRRFTTRVYDPASSVSLGNSHRLNGPLDDLTTAFTSQFAPMLTAPAVPSVIAAPAPTASTGFVDNLLNALPSWLKNVQVKVNPQQLVAAVQQVISPGQAGNAVRMLNQAGVQVDYRGVPITPGTAQYGYQAAGVDWMAYLPWVAGGAALLFVVPMLMKK